MTQTGSAFTTRRRPESRRAGRRVAAVLVLVGAALAGRSAVAAAAPAQQVRCGDTVTTDAFLAQDLRCFAGVGVTLNGDVRLLRDDIRGNKTVVLLTDQDYAEIADSRVALNGVVLRAAFAATARIHGNLFVANRTTVVDSFEPGVPKNLLFETNTFTASADGIFSPASGADLRLRANVARFNAGWGIYAPGAVDLGGNVAHGNGRQPQCVGVVCAGRPAS